jgi:diketogulonate reductase-like aldo/keto reductase
MQKEECERCVLDAISSGYFTNETLKAIGERYNKSNPQVALRYLIQRDVVVIPKQ